MKRLLILCIMTMFVLPLQSVHALTTTPTAPTGMHYVGTVKVSGTCTTAMSTHHLCSLNAFARNVPTAIKEHPNCINCVFPQNRTDGIELCSSQGCWEFHDELDMNWWFTTYSPYGPLSWYQWGSMPYDVGWFDCHTNEGGIGYSVDANCEWRSAALVSYLAPYPSNYTRSYGTMKVCFVASWFPLCGSYWMELEGGAASPSGQIIRSYG